MNNDSKMIDHKATSNNGHSQKPLDLNNNSTSTLDPTNKLTSGNSGKPRGATYDGNVCMICSDRASGFHYGVLACEGCKGFFKRVCKEKIKHLTSGNNGEGTNLKRHCVFGGNCEINVRTRNRCQYCRIQKCVELGMSKDGIKLGRRSKKFKQNLNSTVGNVQENSLSTDDIDINQADQLANKLEQEISNCDSVKLIDNHQLNSASSNNQTPMVAVIQDNKLIFKAIDLLTAAANVSAQINPVYTVTGTVNDTLNSANHIVLANNTHILNNFSNETISSNQSQSGHSIPKVDSNTNNTDNSSTERQESVLTTVCAKPSIPNNSQKLPVLVPSSIINLPRANEVFLSSPSQSLIYLPSNQNGQIIVLNSVKLPETNANNQIVQVTTNEPAQICEPSAKKLKSSNPTSDKASTKSTFYSMLNENQLSNLLEAIVQAQSEIFVKITPSVLSNETLSKLNFKTDISLALILQRGLLAILKETKFLDYFNNLIENAVLFAKNVPYFMNIHETDRITLLKSSVFEIIVVHHATCYSNSYYTQLNDSTKSMDLVTLAAVATASRSPSTFATVNQLNAHGSKSSISQIFSSGSNSQQFKSDFLWIPSAGSWASCQWLGERMPQLKKFMQMLIEFYRFFSIVDLTDSEIAIFCSYLLYKSDGHEFNESSNLSNFRDLFYEILVNELRKKKNPGLFAAANNKLANKYCTASSPVLSMSPGSEDSISKWLDNTCKKLEELNAEHCRVLTEYKSLIQLPDLYAELYNL